MPEPADTAERRRTGDPGAPRPEESALRGRGDGRWADRAFRLLVTGASALVVLAIAGIAVELVVAAVPSLARNEGSFLFGTRWQVSGAEFDAGTAAFGVLNFFKVTVLSSAFALVLAVPIAIGIATFLVEYAPKRLARPLGAVIDLLAAVPSIIFGIWGLFELRPFLEPVASWLNTNLAWFPLFADGNVSIAGGGNIFVAAVVLAIMVLPIITSITREVLRQTPQSQKEAALALGATKWEAIRMTSFPYARSGMIAASMLALGRALGETIAVLIVLSDSARDATWSLFDGGFTFASKIASSAGEFVSSEYTAGAYIAAGLVLFVMTFVVNAIARGIAGGKVNG